MRLDLGRIRNRVSDIPAASVKHLGVGIVVSIYHISYDSSSCLTLCTQTPERSESSNRIDGKYVSVAPLLEASGGDKGLGAAVGISNICKLVGRLIVERTPFGQDFLHRQTCLEICHGVILASAYASLMTADRA